MTITDQAGKSVAYKKQKATQDGLLAYTASLKKNMKYIVTLDEGFVYDGENTYSSKYSFSFTTKK